MYTRLLIIALILGGALIAHVRPVAAQTGERCFAETGHCISGAIRRYWERNGGLSVFGYPIASQRAETVEHRTIQVQWFERDRLEIQADGMITAGRLGARFLELTGRPWQRFPAEEPLDLPACRYFPTTSFNVCGRFLDEWQRNGGLERFGYPISPAFEEPIEGRVYLVQYFERRRMEYHAVNDAPYDVLFGLLGREVLAREGAPAQLPDCARQLSATMQALYPLVQLGRPLGCPVLVPGIDVPAAVQTLERGEMIWYSRIIGPPTVVIGPGILAVIGSGETLSFRAYDDRWVAGQDPDMPAIAPPQPGLYAPWRGFGKVWSEDAELRRQIGWATEPQAQAERADVQLFDSGILLIALRGSGAAYAFGDPSNPHDVQRLR